MPRNPTDPEPTDEIREPQRRLADDDDDERFETSSTSRVDHLDTDRDDLAETDLMEELVEDDLKDMEGPDA